jgi:hypothetical protein
MKIKKFGPVVFAAALILIGPAVAQDKPNFLSGTYPPEVLGTVLLPIGSWHPYPKAGEPGWEKVPEDVCLAQVRQAEKYLNGDWAIPKASVFLDFVRDGNRSRFEAVSFGRRAQLAGLVLAEAIEGRGRFLDDILNGVWTICEETFWGVPAHVSAQRRGAGLPDVTEPIIDLFAAETAMLLAWTDYLVGDGLDRISPLIRERIRFEVDRRILTPGLARDDFWWMGFKGQKLNNWTPWICSNWLAAALLVEKDPARRTQSVFKILRCLDNFLNPYPRDGGCDEGPGYWDRAGGSLYDALELLQSASGGKIDVFDRPIVKEIGRYIGRVHIAGSYFVNFADAAAKPGANASLIFRYGRSIRDDGLIGFGAWLAHQQNLGRSSVGASFGALGRALPTLFGLGDLLAAAPKEPLARDVWFPELQVMAARSFEGSSNGLYLAAKGGHNAESHNHNDVGNFVVFADGEPVLIDVGVETYTAKTFSNRRYEIWTMQSAYHNLPTINGVMQKDGRIYEARDVRYKSDAARAVFSLDIAKAYPPEARVESWKRTLTLERGKRIVLEDSYVLREARQPVRLTLMSWRKPDAVAPGRIRLELPEGHGANRPVEILYEKGMFEVKVETIDLEDGHLRSSWGDRVYRILFIAKKASLKGNYAIRVE